MTYVAVTLVVLVFLNIYCSGVSHKLFYQSKESSMIEKCLLASDEISTLEVLNSSTVTGIVNQLESLKVTRLVVTDHSGAALYDSSGASVGTYVLLPEVLQALTVSKQAPEGNNVFTWTYHDGITDSRAATPIVYYGTVVGCVYMTEYDTTQGALIKSLQQTLLRITLMLEIIVAAFSIAFSNAFSRRLNRIMASMREIIVTLHGKGIETRAIWGLINEQKPYEHEETYQLEKAPYYADRILNIPSSTQITEDEIRYVADEVKQLLSALAEG